VIKWLIDDGGALRAEGGGLETGQSGTRDDRGCGGTRQAQSTTRLDSAGATEGHDGRVDVGCGMWSPGGYDRQADRQEAM
jgi:hypothetical protein